jgi:hypothetical protein
VATAVADSSYGWSGTHWTSRVLDGVRRRPELLTALVCGVVVAIGQRGPDLPAQAYRVSLIRHHGLVIFDSHWYGGHSLPGYSMLFPLLAAVLGSRLVGALSCVAATAAFTRLLRGRDAVGHDLAVMWFAVVSAVDLIVGRLPFALGLAFGIGALAAARERRPSRVLLLSLLCGASSPLAGAFLLLVAAAWLPTAGWRRTWPFAASGFGILVAAAFGEGGSFPFPWSSLLVVLVFVALGLMFAPRDSVVVRRALWLYGVASVVSFLFPNPVGGNMIRLGAVVAGPLAAYELVRRRRTMLLAVLALPLLVWQLAPVPASFAASSGNASARAPYYAGLLRYLGSQTGPQGRLEVPLTQGRWESDYLATSVPLARGWERQLDISHNEVLYDVDLSATAYHDWLLANGVRWVALPDVPLDASETGEAALLQRAHPPRYLQPVWQDAHWKLWQVRDARPLATGPVRLVTLGVSRIDLRMLQPGAAVVLVRWTRFWRVVVGDACVSPTPDGWTQVTAPQAGPVTLSAQVGLSTLAGSGNGGSCSPTGP